LPKQDTPRSLAGCLPERAAYRKVQNTGHAVIETSYAGLNAKAAALIRNPGPYRQGGRSWQI
jgi:hypothetical protein